MWSAGCWRAGSSGSRWILVLCAPRWPGDVLSWHPCILTILAQLNGKQRCGSTGGKGAIPHPSWISCRDWCSWGFIPWPVIYWGSWPGRRQTGFGRARRGQQCLPVPPSPGGRQELPLPKVNPCPARPGSCRQLSHVRTLCPEPSWPQGCDQSSLQGQLGCL